MDLNELSPAARRAFRRWSEAAQVSPEELMRAALEAYVHLASNVPEALPASAPGRKGRR